MKKYWKLKHETVKRIVKKDSEDHSFVKNKWPIYMMISERKNVGKTFRAHLSQNFILG